MIMMMMMAIIMTGAYPGTSHALVSRSTKGAFFKRNNINRPFDLFYENAPDARLRHDWNKSYEPKTVYYRCT